MTAFLTIAGGKTCLLLRSLLMSDVPQTKLFKELAVTLKTTTLWAEAAGDCQKISFPSVKPSKGESITEYMAKHRHLSTHCNIGDFLNQAIRDRLVCGLRNENLRKCVLSDDNLTLKRALEMLRDKKRPTKI